MVNAPMQSGMELSDVLPAWVPWVGPTLTAVTMGLVFLIAPVAVVRWAIRTDVVSMPWPERARRLHVARVSVVLASILLPIVGVLIATVMVGPGAALGRTTVAVGIGLFVVAGSLRESRKLDQWMYGGEVGMRQAVVGWLMGAAPLLMMFVLGVVAPDRLTSGWMIPWSAAVLAIVWVWLRVPLVMARLGVATPADDRLRTIVARASSQANVDVSRVLEARSPSVNAFAFPWLDLLVFTTGILDALTDDELEAITFHELAHLIESPAMTRLRQSQLLAVAALATVIPMNGSFGWVGVAVTVLAALVFLDFVRRRSVREETASDAAAVEASHRTRVFGAALEKTHRIGLIPAVIRRSTHGQLHERLDAAGVDASFDVPNPPPVMPHVVAVGAAVLVVVAMALTPWAAVAVTPDESLTPSLMAATLPMYGTSSLKNLAWEAETDERWADAAIIFGAVADRSNNNYDRFEVVRLWATAGECERAESARDVVDDDSLEADFARDWVDWCLLTGGELSNESS